MVESNYGKGEVLAVTSQWIIHDNSLDGRDDEFAVLISDDIIHVMNPALHITKT